LDGNKCGVATDTPGCASGHTTLQSFSSSKEVLCELGEGEDCHLWATIQKYAVTIRRNHYLLSALKFGDIVINQIDMCILALFCQPRKPRLKK